MQELSTDLLRYIESFLTGKDQIHWGSVNSRCFHELYPQAKDRVLDAINIIKKSLRYRLPPARFHVHLWFAKITRRSYAMWIYHHYGFRLNRHDALLFMVSLACINLQHYGMPVLLDLESTLCIFQKIHDQNVLLTLYILTNEYLEKYPTETISQTPATDLNT